MATQIGELTVKLKLEEFTAWQLFLALLEKVGVDKSSAVEATITVEAGVEGGEVKATGFAKDAENRPIVKDGDFERYTIVRTFTRLVP
jgi:hypothetical protein